MTFPDAYGRHATPEQEQQALLSRLRVTIRGTFKSLCHSVNLYSETKDEQLIELRSALSNVEHQIMTSLPIIDNDHWQAGGPVAWVHPDPHKPDTLWLVVHGVYTKMIFHSGEFKLEKSIQPTLAEAKERLTKIANHINEAAAEARKQYGFRY